MRSLYLRIYFTVVAVLALFALVSGWLLQRHLDEQREGQREAVQAAAAERVEAWAALLVRALPGPSAPADEQVAALRDWSKRLRLPMALDDAQGQRLGASDSFVRREQEGAVSSASGPGGPLGVPRLQSTRLEDGRTLWFARSGQRPGGPAGARGPDGARAAAPWAGGIGGNGAGPQPPWPDGWSLAALLVVLFIAVAGGAWPVVRRLTRRLEALKQGVEAFGAGALHRRVSEDGRDEVAAVAASFNRAATRIEALLRSHQSLLANASHELRSPLARLKMALAMFEDAGPTQRAELRHEIDTDIAELDALVEEVLLASRLDSAAPLDKDDAVGLLGLLAEEASRVRASAEGDDVHVPGEERLLRRAIRNLLENARRYGGDQVVATVHAAGGGAEVRVSDRGPGVPEAYRQRIFEAFFRVPGHSEHSGGVGLGLSLVRQIAERHHGSVRCEPREGGGSCFVLQLPRA
jgi:signal transduction histidine kinase